ncbi:hypothetical protein T09_12160 [Trichinella sp. T9]|uniref:Uncharacterized protein n=1 Tax=Trichinella murrelli TaxID=144512 RepID=A0A0V0THP0_9BILA|nr:hypothetical protein T05_15537 [Trichinella murrelli]KRX58549.1 hypothetical protein T09_12160 [Trichinella sp. T9]
MRPKLLDRKLWMLIHREVFDVITLMNHVRHLQICPHYGTAF